MLALDKIAKEYNESKTPKGKQSVEKLMNHSGAKDSIPLDGDTKLFDRIARNKNVDYAFQKIGPEKYLLLFKSEQAGRITECLSAYANRVMSQGKGRPSILAQLQKFAERVASRAKEPQQRERKREAEHER